MPCLVAPDTRFEASYRGAVAEFVTEGAEHELGSLQSNETFAAFVQALQDQAEGRALPPGWVAGSTFWLVDGDDLIGKVELRHRLTDALRLRRSSSDRTRATVPLEADASPILGPVNTPRGH